MEVRSGFVNDGCSTSFAIRLMHVSKAQLNLIREHLEFSNFMHRLDPEWQMCDPGEEWDLVESGSRLEGSTRGRSFSMSDFFGQIGLHPALARWTSPDMRYYEDDELDDYEAGQIESDSEDADAGPDGEHQLGKAFLDKTHVALGELNLVPAAKTRVESCEHGRARFPGCLFVTHLARLPIYLEKWLRIGVSCEDTDIDKIGAAAVALFTARGWPPPQIVIADGPKTAVKTIIALRSRPIDGGAMVLPRQLQAEVTEQTYSQIRARFGADRFARLIRDMPPLLWGKLEMLSRLPGDCFLEAEHEWFQEVHNRPCIPEVHSLGYPGPVLSHRLRYLLLCDFLVSVAKCPYPDCLAAEIQLAESCGGWIPVLVGRPQQGYTGSGQIAGHAFHPGDKVVVIQRRPCELHTNQNGLHRHGGPAVSYPDGFSIWALNGVRVPRWLAENRSEHISPAEVLEIGNDEVRREFVRKVGIDRICHVLNAECVDKTGNYELLMLDLKDGRERPYLKMLNPSIGTWHLEGVDPNCRTVTEALAWRNGTSVSPEILT